MLNAKYTVEDFVEIQKQRSYESSIRDAAADEAFIKRTMDTQNDFECVDSEGKRYPMHPQRLLMQRR